MPAPYRDQFGVSNTVLPTLRYCRNCTSFNEPVNDRNANTISGKKDKILQALREEVSRVVSYFSLFFYAMI